MIERPIIIGAGVAGLAAANYLVDHNIYPIVIDAASIGLPKVCGEFFAPQAISYLEKWGVPLIYINKANLIASKNSLSFNLPFSHGSVSRQVCEKQLFERAQKGGATFYFNTKVVDLCLAKNINSDHIIKLSNDIEVNSKHLIIATGKLPQANIRQKSISVNEPQFIGIKSHFKNFNAPNELNLFIMDNAYMGVTYVDPETINVCCLVTKNKFDKFSSVDDFMLHTINTYYPQLKLDKNPTQIHNPWLTAPVFAFGKKDLPNWPNTYFIGDAYASIHPASGNGLTLGLLSGILAAQQIIGESDCDYQKQINSLYNSKLRYGKFLHYLFTHPFQASIGFKVGCLYPKLYKKLYFINYK